MKIYKITEASDYLGVSINTLKTLANNGKIKSFKTTGEHRRFRQEDLDAYMGVEKEKQEKLTIIYARCSTAKQKENLERQKDRLRKHAEAKGYKYMMIDEIASGINEKRTGIHKLIKMCFEGKVGRVLIEYKDRLARFGYEYLDAIFSNLEITVEIMEVKDKKYEEELTERRKLRWFVDDYKPHLRRRPPKKIESWNIKDAINVARDIVERYNSRPYGFRFSTRERGPKDFDSKKTIQSRTYFLGGKIETLEEVGSGLAWFFRDLSKRQRHHHFHKTKSESLSHEAFLSVTVGNGPAWRWLSVLTASWDSDFGNVLD